MYESGGLMQFTVSQLYIQMIKQAYEARGRDFPQLYNKLFDESARQGHRSKDLRIDIVEINRLWQGVIQSLNEPLFALKVGVDTHPSDYGILGIVWMNSQTLLECYKLVIEYSPLMNDAFDARYYIDGNDFIYTLAVSSLKPHEEANFVDHNIASIFHMGQFLVGSRHRKDIVFKSVKLRHEHNSSLQQEYERLLNCPVFMGQECNQIILDMSVLNLPVHLPDLGMQKLMLTKSKKLVHKKENTAPISKEVLSYLNKNFGGNLPTAEVTAKYLGLSLSSFKRSLASEGTRYQQLIDDERYRHAVDMLSVRKHSICEISFLLSYSNASSFSRAFKSRTGLSPKEFRNQQNNS
jgi:AraC-like DNA-binding protein